MQRDFFYPYLREMLERMDKKDPRTMLFAEFLKRSEISSDESRIEEEQRKNRALKIKRLKREYRILLERNNLCASALGMCPQCWGTDIGCSCHGKGGPGYMLPNKQDFSELVLPALNRLGISVPKDPNELTANDDS